MGRFIFVLLFSLFAFTNSWAQEGGAVSEGAKPEGDGKAAAPVKDDKGSTQQEVLDLQARLQGLKTKIAAKKEILRKLIAEKQTIREEKKSIEVFNDMKTEYKEMQAAIREYDEQLSLLSYRYPEKGLNKERQYERIEIKTLDEIESEFSLEGKIKKAMARVRQQYPEKNGVVKKSKTTEPVEVPSVKAKDPSRTSVTESQLLSK